MKTQLSVAASLAAAVVLSLTACSGKKEAPVEKMDPKAFVDQANKELVDQLREINAAGWTQSTDITVDTQYLNARATERILEWYSRKAGEAKVYDNDKLDASTARSLLLLKLGVSAPAPADAAKRSELAATRSSSSSPKRKAARTSTNSATSSPPAATTPS